MKRKGLLTALVVASAMFAATASVSADEGAELIKDIATVQAFTEEAVAEEDIEAIVAAGINAPSAMNNQPWHFSVVTDKSVLEEISGGMSFGGPKGMTPPAGDSSEGGEAPEGFTMPEEGEAPEGFTMPEGGEAPQGFAMPEGGEKPEGTVPTTSGAKAGMTDAPLVIIVSCKSGSDLDAGLATQNMSAEAQLLGYGTKILTSPTMSLNGERQAEFKELLGIPEDMAAVSVLLVGKTDTEAYDAVSSATTRNGDEVVTYVNP